MPSAPGISGHGYATEAAAVDVFTRGQDQIIAEPHPRQPPLSGVYAAGDDGHRDRACPLTAGVLIPLELPTLPRSEMSNQITTSRLPIRNTGLPPANTHQGVRPER